MTLEHMALRWLLYEKRCHAVLYERTPRSYGNCRPDVIGITPARYLIEIEVKRSMQDFKANGHKHGIRNRDIYLKRWPKQFYYLVPDSIAEKIEGLLPDWAGLARARDEWTFEVVRAAPDNRDSARLSAKECARLFRCQSNQLISTEASLENFRQRFKDGHWWEPDYVI